MSEVSFFWGTGRRKTSTARVRIVPGGTGVALVNHKPIETYFERPALIKMIMEPFEITDSINKYDLYVNVKGGGKSGQAGAIRHGIARALLSALPDLRPVLKKSGLLTRDARVKERKKYGQRGARARYQFSKR